LAVPMTNGAKLEFVAAGNVLVSNTFLQGSNGFWSPGNDVEPVRLGKTPRGRGTGEGGS
jgi:hypothetical protein